MKAIQGEQYWDTCGWVVQRETGYASGVGMALVPLFSREHAHANGPHARNHHFDHREVGWAWQSTEHRLVTKSLTPRWENKKAFENHYYIKWNDNSFIKCLPWAVAAFNSHKRLPKMYYCILLFSGWGYGVSVRLISLSCSHSFRVADGKIIPMIIDPCIFFYHDVGLRSGDQLNSSISLTYPQTLDHNLSMIWECLNFLIFLHP